MINPLWMIPAAIFVVLFVIRLLLAPYEIDKKRKQQINKLKQNLADIRKQNDVSITSTLLTGPITIEVVIASNFTGYSDSSDFVGQPPRAYFSLMKEQEVLVEMITKDISKESIGNNEVRYKANFNLDTKDVSVGSDLAEANFAQIQFEGMPGNSKIICGLVTCIFNNSIPILIPVSSQIMKEDDIIIPQIQRYFLGK